MSPRRHWSDDQAKQILDIVSQNGASREVSVGYIASALRMAHQRGAIEATRPKPAPEKKAAAE